MPRSRSLLAAATVASFAACFSDLGGDPSGLTDSTGGTTSTTGAATTGATTTGTTSTTAPLTTGDVTSIDPTAAGICGDGIIGPGEACDDGDADNTDACTNVCQPPACGDGFVQPGEQCDDANQIDDDGCDASCHTGGCGDGVVEDGEECDDGNTDDEDGCGACARKFFHVFVTSSVIDGAIGGVAAADAHCAGTANKVGLAGTYLAWLAVPDGNDPDQRFTHSVVPYVLPDRQTVVADSFDALLVGLLQPINQTETGLTLPGGGGDCGDAKGVWTGLLASGVPTGSHCSGWTSNDANNVGNAGDFTAVNGWTSACNAQCDRPLHLYCFQQGP